jgi:hypothetical protein
MLYSSYIQLSEEDAQKRRSFQLLGNPNKFSWFYEDFFGAANNRLRYSAGSGGAVGAIDGAGPGVITMYGPTVAGTSLVDSFNGVYSSIRSVRGRWVIGMLARTPTAFSAVANAGLLVATAASVHVSVGVFGSISQTAWRVARSSGGAFNANGASTLSTKTVSDTTGSAGTFYPIILMSDGTNFKASVDNEPLITLGPVTSVTDGSAIFGAWSQPTGASTSDGFHIDALFCGQVP